MLVTNESEATDTLQCSLIKQITGNDEYSGRLLNENPITFTPQFTPFILTNNPPKIPHMDDAMTRRIDMIKFPFKFFDSKNDVGFEESEYLKTHFLGKNPDLAMMLEECKNEFFLYLLEIYNEHVRYATHLEPTTNHQNATNEYISEQNELLHFIHDNYIYSDRGTPSSYIMNHYNKVCLGPKHNSTTFGKAMAKLGIEREIKRDFTHYKLICNRKIEEDEKTTFLPHK